MNVTESQGKDFLQTVDFKLTHQLPGVLIDANSRMLCFFPGDHFDPVKPHHFIGFNGIVGTRVMQGEHTITRTSNGSILGRGLVGGLIFGGVGTVIGSLTAKKESRTHRDKLVVEVFIDVDEYPLHRIDIIRLTHFSAAAMQMTEDDALFLTEGIFELIMLGETIPVVKGSETLTAKGFLGKPFADLIRMKAMKAQREGASQSAIG